MFSPRLRRGENPEISGFRLSKPDLIRGSHMVWGVVQCGEIAFSGPAKRGPRKAGLWLCGEKEGQRSERALTFEKSRGKRYTACPDVNCPPTFDTLLACRLGRAVPRPTGTHRPFWDAARMHRKSQKCIAIVRTQWYNTKKVICCTRERSVSHGQNSKSLRPH